MEVGVFFCVWARLRQSPFTHIREGGTITAVSRLHHIVALGLICLWICSPALACLPNSQMTAAEMACCKKMAGECHMGVGAHPCCKTISTAPQPVASLQSISQLEPPVAIVVEIAVVSVPSILEAEATQADLGLPPPAPPALHTILRI